MLLAVADGHGSAKSFRSDVGSRLAVETALAVCQEFLDSQSDPPDLSACKRARRRICRWRSSGGGKQRLPAIWWSIRCCVKEVARVEESQGAVARQAVEKNPVHAYGATLIGIILHESFLACLQIGDGDVLVVTDTGKVIRPMHDDPRLLANETTSLGSRDCWRDFRVCFQVLADSPPALLLVSTDGYSNSFSNPQGFLAVGSDLLTILRAEGIQKPSGGPAPVA